MGELTPEAIAELKAAIAIVKSDKDGQFNEATMRRVFKEEMQAYKPPADPPVDPPVDPPIPPGPTPPPPSPPPPTPPTPPTPPPTDKKRSRYWGEYD